MLEVTAYDPVAREFWNGQLQLFVDQAEIWLRAEQKAGRTSAGLNPATAAEVFVWGGFQVLADQVLNGPEDQAGFVAREIALLEWHGAFCRP